MSTSNPELMLVAVPAGIVIKCFSGSGVPTIRLKATLPSTIVTPKIAKRVNRANEALSPFVSEVLGKDAFTTPKSNCC